MEFWQWLVEACIPGLVVGVMMAYFNRHQSAHAKDRAELEERKVRADLLRTDLLMADSKLTYAVAMAIKRGTPNGEIEEGIAAYDAAMTKFREFEREQLVRHTLEKE